MVLLGTALCCVVERTGWEAHHGGVLSSLTGAPRCGDAVIVSQASAAEQVTQSDANMSSCLLKLSTTSSHRLTDSAAGLRFARRDGR